jgi:phage tail-like protein
MPTTNLPFLVPTVQFEVTLPPAPLGYFSEVSGLSAEVEVMSYNEGGNNGFVHKLPTRVKHPNLVLKQGITDQEELLRWFRKTHVEAERVNVTVTMLAADKQRLRTWSFTNAFPVKWTGPTFNAGQAQIATETLEIAHEGMGPA